MTKINRSVPAAVRRSLAVSGVLVLGFVLGARTPNLDLHFVRNIPTTLTLERLGKNVSSVARWPQWFFSLARVTVLDSPSLRLASMHVQHGSLRQTSQQISLHRDDPTLRDPSLIEKGSILSLEMNSHRYLSQPFVLTAEVTEFQPLHTLRLKILEDSSGRLTRLFDHLEWQLDFEAQPGGGAIIHAREVAHTRYWKSRFFGRLAERILMNQVFYPDIIKLSELKQPFSVDDGPKAKGGFGTGAD